MYQIEEHLAPLPGVITNSLLDESSSDNDSSVEVMSIVDENEYELIKWTNYLQLNSDSDDDSDDNYSSTQPALLVNYSSSESSSDEEELLQSSHQAASSNNNSIVDTTSSSTSTTINKRKRRQWTVNEKLNAIIYFEKNNNKSKTANDIGCATKQLRMWIKNKDELIKLSSQKKGKKRMRRNGAGKKLIYVDLDSRLLTWYRQKRTAPGSTTTPITDIRKEKVTFRYLQRRGRQISQELNHPCPSSKWFGRFLVRHRLSLQRPKRQQKIPLDEVHQKATSFYNYLRRASRWAPKRGPMGAFTPRDVFNMDESPLALFGDQAKRSINDINTCNEVEGCLSNKRFCTVILTVSGEDQRVDPVLLFKGKGHISPNEQKQYANGIKVFFTPESVINTITMNKYNEWFISKVRHF
ncbi:unnamed protein product [Rotaria socialis]|uniref:HTH psq-type domain-containing protein n=1 Tax=Rotaria socialis TaxID=392032 RepID=A0A818C3C1_9BILA|nr:unnamed protein product [Rotaria socialis]CAF3423220.1 unnamed protein product [Rotaria socialis]